MIPERRTAQRSGRLAALLAALLLLTGSAACYHHGTNLGTLGADQLFERGMSKYQSHDWDDAITAFQQFTFRFPTHGRVEEARYMLAQSYFGKGEYVTAAHEFSRLADDYPTGPWADDARFRTCQAYLRLSPDPQLDQEYTRAAIDHCQSLVAYYPDSEYAPKAKAIVEDMQTKLAQKLFEGGEYYFKRKAFDSAIIYFQDVVTKFPDTKVAPEALLKVVQAYQKIGWTEEADAAKQRLLQSYPNSAAAKAVSDGGPANGR